MTFLLVVSILFLVVFQTLTILFIISYAVGQFCCRISGIRIWYSNISSIGIACKSSLYELLMAICADERYLTQSDLLSLAYILRYCFSIWFILFVWPSVCGWNAVNIASSVSRASFIFCVNFVMNSLSLSVIIFSETPWSAYTSLAYMYVSCLASMSVLYEMNLAYFVNPSTMVIIIL